MQMKICSKCGKKLPLTTEYYWIDKTHKDGFRSSCKECGSKHPINEMIIPKGYKKCNKCGQILSIDNYYKNNSSKDKLYAHCKKCSKKAERRYVETNKDRVRRLRKQYVEGNKENLQRYNKQYSKEYYALHREEKRDKEIERGKKYRQENKDKTSTYGKKYRQNNKDKINILTQRYRARKRKLPSTLTIKQWEAIKQYFNNSCCYCGKKLPLEQEHFIPVTKDGEFSPSNIICACRSCNASKNNADFFEWYPKQLFYSKKREQNILKFLNYKDNTQQIKII